MVGCNMGSSGSAFKDVTFHPLPHDYRCPGAGGDVLVGSGTPPWTPTDSHVRPRPTICINLLATRVPSSGD